MVSTVGASEDLYQRSLTRRRQRASNANDFVAKYTEGLTEAEAEDVRGWMVWSEYGKGKEWNFGSSTDESNANSPPLPTTRSMPTLSKKSSFFKSLPILRKAKSDACVKTSFKEQRRAEQAKEGRSCKKALRKNRFVEKKTEEKSADTKIENKRLARVNEERDAAYYRSKGVRTFSVSEHQNYVRNQSRKQFHGEGKVAVTRRPHRAFEKTHVHKAKPIQRVKTAAKSMRSMHPRRPSPLVHAARQRSQ